MFTPSNDPLQTLKKYHASVKRAKNGPGTLRSEEMRARRKTRTVKTTMMAGTAYVEIDNVILKLAVKRRVNSSWKVWQTMV